MTDPMASEPAEPTTRQDREWLAGMIAAFLSGARGVGVLHMKPWPEVAERLVAWLDDRQLLADPAQTTELEELRAKVATLEAEVVKQRIIAKNATDSWRQGWQRMRIQRDYASARLELRKLNDAMARKNRVIAKRESERDLALWLHAEAVWQRDLARELLADVTRVFDAERDERQARIDEHEDLLSSIWLYVKWRYVTKQLTAEQKNLWADAVEEISERHHPGEGTKVDRWWQDGETAPLSGEALRDVEERDDAAGDLP